ncbi:hypothetical protein XHC_2575 [Xanthomonas hortorum pv. carotae str. M081]|nr:hypothetical protein XHC_2575 [Xanthomonas hortorum pv. carotae str. M081]
MEEGEDADVGASGTGSNPPGWKGWQRPSRRAASQQPRSGPKRPIAVIAYSEQLGANRQRGPNRGLMNIL